MWLRNPVPGVLVKFDHLTFKVKTPEGTNDMATNGTQLMQMLRRVSRRRAEKDKNPAAGRSQEAEAWK